MRRVLPSEDRIEVRRRRRIARVAALLLLFVATAVVAAEAPRRISLTGIGVGLEGRNDLGIAMLEARLTLSPHLFVTAAPAILSVESGDTEYQLRTGATLLFRAGPVRIDDRNLWVFSDAGTTRYRNRLRLTLPVDVSGRELRLQVLNEAFYEEGGRGWFRNLAGPGVGFNVGSSVALDAYWLVHEDDHRPRTSMFLLVLTMPVTSFDLQRR